MNLECLKVGQLETNCYILTKENKSIIIDPGDDFLKIKNSIKNKLVGVLLTHSHFDHIGAIEQVKNYYQVPIYDFNNIEETNLDIDVFNIKVIKNPGHSFDSISFLIEDKLFCGDFIFKDTIGRTDFPTGSMNQMQESIKNILKYPDDLIIYPGHGEFTTLMKERVTLESFL